MKRLARISLVLLLTLYACGEQDVGTRGIEAVGEAVEQLAGRRPPTRGLHPALLDSAYARAADMPRLRSLLVARHGELHREEYFHGSEPERHANIKSASKSVLSALIGIAIAEGHLNGVDQPIEPFFTDQIPQGADPRVRSITIGNLLSMQAGLRSTSFDNYADWVTSRDWIAYAREKLARPLGIELRPWTTDPDGIYFGGNEMRMRPRDMLRFGELYRNGGVLDSVQVVPREWVEESWEPRTTSPFDRHGYGYGWWNRRAGGHTVHFAWGYGGQFIFVVPYLEMTVVTTSDPTASRGGPHLRALHELVARVLIPAAERGEQSAAG